MEMEKVTPQDFDAIDKIDNKNAPEERQKLMEPIQVSPSSCVHANPKEIFSSKFRFFKRMFD